MWNTQLPGTEREITRWAVKMLGERLPAAWRLDEIGHQGRWKNLRPDAVIRLRGPDGMKAEIVLEIKRRIDPKDVVGVVAQARSIAGGRPILVGAVFLSPRTRERLRQEQVGYVDATGNVWLILDRPAVYIETMGMEKDPQSESRSLSSLKGRAAGRVVRALCDYKPPYGVRELADRSRTALASISRVVALLDQEAMIGRNAKGRITDVDIDAVIRRWTQDYSLLQSNSTENFLEPRNFKTLTEKLRGFQGKYAVTGSLAAVAKIRAAEPRLAVVYVEELTTAAKSLGLKSIDAGTNVILARPFDSVVYERGSTVDGVYYAAPSQVAADLLTSPGRGPSDGEELIGWMKENPDAWRT